jgi:hypothetical protein
VSKSPPDKLRLLGDDVNRNPYRKYGPQTGRLVSCGKPYHAHRPKERTVAHRAQVIQRLRNGCMQTGNPISSSLRLRMTQNLAEMEETLKRIDVQIAWISQFERAQSVGEKLFNKRHPAKTFADLDQDTRDVWEELAAFPTK